MRGGVRVDTRGGWMVKIEYDSRLLSVNLFVNIKANTNNHFAIRTSVK